MAKDETLTSPRLDSKSIVTLLTKRHQQLLANIIKKETFSTGLLLHGPKGALLPKIAEAAIQSLFCPNADPYACQTCLTCTTYHHQNLPDMITVNPDGKLLIEHIRDLQNTIKYGPSTYDKLCVLIPNVHLMTEQAANAFLKLLEEPPAGVCFIMTTHSLSEILPTIRSRCRMIDFPGLSSSQLQLFLDHHYNTEQRTDIEKQCFGDAALLKEYLETGDTLSQEEYRSFSEFKKSTLLDAFQIAETLSKSKAHAVMLLTAWINEISKNPAHEELPPLIEALSQMRYNVNLKLHLESLFLKLMS